jgi:hypothetical protein
MVGVIFARAMAVACLTVMKALLWFTGALLLLLTIVQHFRGDVYARPMVTMMTGLVAAGLGFACAFAAKWFQSQGSGR